MAEIIEQHVDTARLRTRTLQSGSGEAVLFVHGNLSNADVWREQLSLLAPGLHGIAADLRGFGGSETKPIDATRGLRDLSDDMFALLDALGIDRAHVVGHSTGGGIVMQMAIDQPARIASSTLIAPVSPYGYGGTRRDGSLAAPDAAGSGGGTANPELVKLIAAGERDDDSPVAPVNVVRTLFFASPDNVRQEDVLVDGIMQAVVGDDNYPGDSVPSDNWPGVAPGTRGLLNTMAPTYCNMTAIGQPGTGGPVLWIRGDADAIVSNTALTDLGYLGQIGAVPGWPGEDIFPAQPMIDQTRDVLSNRSDVTEKVFAGAGHFPYIEHAEECTQLLDEHVRAAS